MQTFRDSKLTLAEIAQKIRATHVIEGSVRRDDLRVRLTVQLIDARTDDHLWAETYDRPLTDALTLQSAVAKEVAQALRVAMGGGAAEAPPSAVPAAYDLYLKARLTTDLEDQLKLLDSALLLDPGFTLARAKRASAACLTLWFDGTRLVELAAQARADIDRARTERPGLPEIDIAESEYIYRVLRDYPAALAIVERVLASDVNNVEALGLRGAVLRRLGRAEESLAAARRHRELDPNNPNTAIGLVDILGFYGKYREAIGVLDEAMTRLPPDATSDLENLERWKVNLSFMLTGDVEALVHWAESKQSRTPEVEEVLWAARGPSVERLAYLASLRDEWAKQANSLVYPMALNVALDADFLGDRAALQQALDEAERLYATLAPEVMALPQVYAHHAQLLALSGESAAAIAEVERAINALPPGEDVLIASNIRSTAVFTLARAGAEDRAIEVAENLMNAQRSGGLQLQTLGAFDYHDKIYQALLGDDPRYQALLKKIEARFEKL